MTDTILRAIAAGGRRGVKLADIICQLVVKGGELGELEKVIYPDAGVWKVGKRMPREWLDRLDRAIETDAIDIVSSDRIVKILLQGRAQQTP